MSTGQEVLEALGHPHGALPEPRLLANLFVRFQAQVPLRRAPGDLEVEAVLGAWLEDGSGCCGESRVGAFEALAVAAGFAVESARARRPDGESHRVLLAHGRRVLLDPSFPFPAPLSLEPPVEAEATGYGTLSARIGADDRFEVRLETRGDERVLYRVGPDGATRESSRARAGVAGAGFDGLFRLHADRLVRWQHGVLEVSDAWSRLRSPFPASDVEGLEALFGPPISALEPPESPKRENPTSTLAVYHTSTAAVPSLGALLADPAVHEALLPEGWAVQRLAVREDGFERTLVEKGALLRTERITLLPDGITVESDGPLALFRTRTWTMTPRPSGTRLRLFAVLRHPAPPRGLPDGLRRRLVFELASELLALDARAAQR